MTLKKATLKNKRSKKEQYTTKDTTRKNEKKQDQLNRQFKKSKSKQKLCPKFLLK